VRGFAAAAALNCELGGERKEERKKKERKTDCKY